jgi:hypothetical protein
MEFLSYNTAIKNAAAKTSDELTHSRRYDLRGCNLGLTLISQIASLTSSLAALISSVISRGICFGDTSRGILCARFSQPPHSQALKLDGLPSDFRKMIAGCASLPLGDLIATFVIGNRFIQSDRMISHLIVAETYLDK